MVDNFLFGNADDDTKQGKGYIILFVNYGQVQGTRKKINNRIVRLYMRSEIIRYAWIIYVTANSTLSQPALVFDSQTNQYLKRILNFYNFGLCPFLA